MGVLCSCLRGLIYKMPGFQFDSPAEDHPDLPMISTERTRPSKRDL